MAEQIIITGDGKDNLYTGALKINQAIQELSEKIGSDGSVPYFMAGLLANRPTPDNSGRIYIAIDATEKKFYRDNGEWELIGGAEVNWDTIEGKPDTFTATAHKNSHKTGGSDELTADNIGAAQANHDHNTVYYTKANLQTSGQASVCYDNLFDRPSEFNPTTHGGDKHTANYYHSENDGKGSGMDADKFQALDLSDFRFLIAADETQQSSYGTSSTVQKSFRVIKSATNGMRVNKLHFLAELWVNGATGYIDIRVDGTVRLAMQTTNLTATLVQGNIDVSSWGDNSVHTIEVFTRNSGTKTTYIRTLECLATIG